MCIMRVAERSEVGSLLQLRQLRLEQPVLVLVGLQLGKQAVVVARLALQVLDILLPSLPEGALCVPVLGGAFCVSERLARLPDQVALWVDMLAVVEDSDSRERGGGQCGGVVQQGGWRGGRVLLLRQGQVGKVRLHVHHALRRRGGGQVRMRRIRPAVQDHGHLHAEQSVGGVFGRGGGPGVCGEAAVGQRLRGWFETPVEVGANMQGVGGGLGGEIEVRLVHGGLGRTLAGRRARDEG